MSMEHPEKQKNAVKSVVDQVMDGIISQIIDGTLHPGDKLPTEMELCKQFGAGRNSVREAVKKLQAYGILYIKRADGTFVSENYNQKMLDPMLYSIILQKNSWQEFVELRSVIDIGTLNIIIQRNDIASSCRICTAPSASFLPKCTRRSLRWTRCWNWTAGSTPRSPMRPRTPCWPPSLSTSPG